MINTLYLPELREMIRASDQLGLREFCTALHPARTAEFMEGLDPGESWAVLRHAESQLRSQIFSYFDSETQTGIIESQPRSEVAELIADLPPDDRVDMIEEVDEEAVAELLPLLPIEERRDILRLLGYAEDTAGALMTTDVAKLPESLTVRDALRELGRQAEELETIYYLYVVDEKDHLRGVVSARQLVSQLGRPDTPLAELMETDVVSVNVTDDQEDVARTVAKFDLLAIPVVNHERALLGIITHDDVIDVMREEATEDAHRIAAMDPLDEGYLKTGLFTLGWKRGMWLAILFIPGSLTALAMQHYGDDLKNWMWLAWFVPLIISSGGNTGSQSATLIITALATGDITLADWARVVWRELRVGLLLGAMLGLIGFVGAWLVMGSFWYAVILPMALMLVVTCGTLAGSILPLIFHRLGLDPALMSNPFVAAIMDILGILIYMNVALAVLHTLPTS